MSGRLSEGAIAVRDPEAEGAGMGLACEGSGGNVRTASCLGLWRRAGGGGCGERPGAAPWAVSPQRSVSERSVAPFSCSSSLFQAIMQGENVCKPVLQVIVSTGVVKGINVWF